MEIAEGSGLSAPDHPPNPPPTDPPTDPAIDPAIDPANPTNPIHPSEELDVTVVVDRPPVSGAAISLLERARTGLLEACADRDPSTRYVAAHLAGLRAAAAVLAVRGRADRHRTQRLRSVWEVLPTVAPELTEWATFFSAGAPVRAAVEAGRTSLVDPRAADDLLRDAETFTRIATELLGLPWQPVLPPALPASG